MVQGTERVAVQTNCAPPHMEAHGYAVKERLWFELTTALLTYNNAFSVRV